MSNNSHTEAGVNRPLELSGSEMQELVDSAMRRIVEHIGQLYRMPAHNLDGADIAARELIERAPWEGRPAEELLNHLFDDVIPKSLTTPGPGFMAYIPGGGIFHAAVADLIADSVNRYVGASLPAPGLARLEANVVDWFAEILGYGPGAGGFLTTGGSLANFTATIVARDAIPASDFARATVYASDQVHHSVLKAARMAGLDPENVRAVGSDELFRIDCDRLERALERDRSDGRRPILVVGSAGTTNTGAVDPLDRVADIARRHDAWFHVDAAYGGFFILTERGKRALRGIEKADSVTLDPHKGMFLPYGTGALVVKELERLRRAHSLPADYLPELGQDSRLIDFCEISPELSRDFRGLRVWLPVKMHGFGVFRDNLNEKLDLARLATEELRGIPDLQIVAEPELSVVAFRLKTDSRSPSQLNDLNRRFLAEINSRKRIYITGTLLRGEFVLRICVLSFRTHEDRLLEGIDDVRAAATEVLGS